jgi:hypothetical protein
MADNATAKDVVDLAMDDKPNAAGEALNDILLNKVGEKVSAMKDQISNDMFGQEMPEPVEDEEDVEVQPELDLEPNEEEGEEYEADQELIDEPADEDESEEEEQPEQSDEEEEE